MFLNFVCERCHNPFNDDEHKDKTSARKLCPKCMIDEKSEKELRKNYNLIKKRLFS